DERKPHHVGGDVVAFEVSGEAAFFVGRQLAVALGVGVGLEDVFVGRDQESGGAAGGIEDRFIFLGGNDGDDEVDDVARRAELPGVALRAEHAEEILEGVAEALGMVVGKLVDDLEKHLERFGVAIGQIGVLEDVAKERRDAGVLGHLGDALG